MEGDGNYRLTWTPDNDGEAREEGGVRELCQLLAETTEVPWMPPQKPGAAENALYQRLIYLYG